MKKRILTLMLLLIAFVFVAEANPVDMSTAHEVAVQFVNANAKMPLRGADELRLVATYNTTHGDAAFHVFNTPNGFVIVSADDCATPILGYSDEGQFDMENVPIQLQDYLQDFVEQIEYSIENHLETDERIARQWNLVRHTGWLNENRDGESMEPLITAMWDQGCYYNNLCPAKSNGPCGHCVTGCVATAMGMLLHYWGYPAQGTGSYSYSQAGYPVQSVNFGETTYDWAYMPNQLTDTSTPTEIDAVSTLLWHCGVAVNTIYGPSASGAVFEYVSTALSNYYNYSDDMHWEAKQDDETWALWLKADLNLGHPVYYCGSSLTGGHAFICDGYDVNDRFHFNWGWSGNSNGYFALTATLNYIYGNSALFNIHPRDVITHQVTASADPSDGGTIEGAGLYDTGNMCTLTATANEGYIFMYWSENDEMVSTQAEYSFCVRRDRDLVAHFGTPFQIEVEVVPMEGGTVSGVGEYAYGSICTLTATANEGYDFICWRKANGSVVSTALTYAFTVTEATTLTAVFAVLGGEQIVFADLNVKAICVANWDTNGDGEFSYTEAAAVTNLGTAFRENTQITSFEELQYFTGLTTIDSYAFYNCSNLLGSLIIPNAVATIGISAFEGCSSFTGDLSIPNAVTTIEEYAFYNCTGFTGSLTIGDAVTTIGTRAFYNCSGFTGNLTIGNAVTTIGTRAFQNCSGFTGDLIIGNAVTTIGTRAFQNCTGFTGSLTLPDSVTAILGYAFYHCTGFTGNLTLPNSVTTIGEHAFENCTSFTGNLILPNSITTIEKGVFSSCTGFTGSLTIPNSVTTIGEYAFYNCTGFTGSLTIGDAVTGIGSYAFKNCSGFTGSLTIGEAVTEIGYDAFENCSGFTGDLTIPNSVIRLRADVFANCSGFTGDLTIGNSVTSIGNNVFKNCSGFTGNLTIGNSVVLIGNSAFEGCSGFTGGLTIPNSVTTVGNYAFYHCTGFTGSLTIGNSVTSIGGNAFSGCSGFTGNLTIPNSVTTIGSSAFRNCSGLTGNLVIPNTVTSIGSAAFSGCSGFTGDLTLPNSLTSIAGATFYNCTGFTGDLVIPNSIISIEGASQGAFENCIGLTGDLTLPNTVTTIGDRAFYGCIGLTGDLTLPNTVTTIGNYSFYGCSGFTGSLTIPNAVTTIGNYAFRGCSGLNGNLTIPNSVTSIGSNAFWGCSGLNGDLTIPNSVTSIGSSAFNGCSGFLGSLTIGSSVATIGNFAFYLCSGFTSINSLAEVPPTLAVSVFYGVNHDIPVYVSCGTLDAYQNAGGWNEFTHFVELCENSITAIANPTIGGTVTGGGTYYTGITCTLTATPNEGYHFESWTRNDTVVSTNPTYSFRVAESATYVANFNDHITQVNDLARGWNWWSSYIEQDGINGLTMLEESLGDNGHQIKSQTDFVTNYGFMWMGMLSGINNEESYMLDNTADCQIELTGMPVSPADHPIIISNGWNWIGYPCTQTMSLAEAFAGYTPTNGDQVKSQADYVVYFSGMWIGHLQNIIPGMGLMYMSNSATTTTLVYPEEGHDTEATVSVPKAKHWTNNIHAYPNNMTVLAAVELDGVEIQSENYELAVFDNGECRGSARLLFVEPLNRYLAFLTIAGDDVALLNFGLYDVTTGEECFSSSDRVVFATNATLGSTDEPFVVSFHGTEGLDELDNHVEVFPNPVDRGMRLSIGTADNANIVRVEIVNALGETLRATSTQMSATLTAPTVAGVYTLRITVEGKGTMMRKLVVR